MSVSASEDRYVLHRRFDRLGRLVGDEGMERLFASHVMVIGLGGVGSHAAEMLARSGVGRLTLVDFDLVCITNVNRQVQALQGAIGKPKAALTAERCQRINPQARVEAHHAFYDEKTADPLLALAPDVVVDAIDSLTAKAHLIASCRERGLRLITSTGSGGRMDPTQVRVADLADVQGDALARELRKLLRKRHGLEIAPGQPIGLPAVYSAEPAITPVELTYDGGQGFRCVCPQGKDPERPFSCEKRRVIWGTAGFVTAAFGMACAAHVVAFESGRRERWEADPPA